MKTPIHSTKLLSSLFMIMIEFLIPQNNLIAAEIDLEKVDFDNLWFRPSLIENNDSLCTKVLNDIDKTFISDKNVHGVFTNGNEMLAGAHPVRLYKDHFDSSKDIAEFEIVQFSDENNGRPFSMDIATISLDGRKIYLLNDLAIGCGGACDQERLIVSDKPLYLRNYTHKENLDDSKHPPFSDGYMLYKISENNYFLYVRESPGLSIYKLNTDLSWDKTCQISLKPEDYKNAGDAYIKLLVPYGKFTSSIGEMILDSGPSCGSSQAHGRLIKRFSELQDELIYRPWSLNDYNIFSYERTSSYLENWSLKGSFEFDRYSKYLMSHKEFVPYLASFYASANQWDMKTAEMMAVFSTKQFVAETISTASNKTVSNHEIREAILKKDLVLDIIKKINEEDADVNSLLDLMVGYPELLEAVFNKLNLQQNEPSNEFGKTALMYAVQQNQLHSVKILLEAGADPNMGTTRPPNNCEYNLKTFNMTPLHYAVRYASPEIISLLLKNGALTFAKAQNYNSYPMQEEMPIDWLRRYTGADSMEKNPNIPEEKLVEIESWLKPPTDEQAMALANNYVLKAEEYYQLSEIARAYRYISLANQLRPDDHRVLSDLALIALKNNKIDESMKASQKIISGDADTHTKAAAYFNQGLVCEQYNNERQNSRGFYFDGKTYCGNDNYGVMRLYTEALSLERSPSRMEKIKALFNQNIVNYCTIPNGKNNIKIYFQIDSARTKKSGNSKNQVIYVLHDSSVSISEADIGYNHDKLGAYESLSIFEKVAGYDLDGSELSVYKTITGDIQFPFSAFGATCQSTDSIALPKND